MKKLKLIAIFFLLALTHSAKAQSSWDTYDIGKIFSLSVPPTMTLRDPESVIGKVMDQAVKKFTIELGGTASDWKYTFVPTSGTTMERYARIIVSVNRQNGLTQKMVKEATAADLKDFSDSRVEMSKQMGMAIKNCSAKKAVYDGKYAIVLYYDRPGLSGDVRVEDYYFFLLNKMIEVTISYRLSEASVWKTDFSKIAGTFKFN